MPQAPENSRQETRLTRLIAKRRPVSLALVALALGLFLLAIWLGFQLDQEGWGGFSFDWDYWPEAVGTFLLALISLGAGLWLRLAPAARVTVSSTRVLVLAVGGLTGLVIALAALGRALRWWDVVFAGGIEAWRGPQGYRLWVCVVAELVGLALMFVSLLPARAEERTSAVLRRLLYGYNTVLTGLLLLAILVVGNILVYAAVPGTYNWTRTRGIYSLSSRSRQVLAGLKQDVWVYVVLAQRNLLAQEVHTLLDNMQAVSAHIKVRNISPDLQAEEFEQLKKRFPSLPFERGIVLSYGGPFETSSSTQIAFIPERRLFEGARETPPGRPRETTVTLVFKGEDVLLSEINFLAGGRKSPKIYFLQGDGEPGLNDTGVLGLYQLRLQLERDKFQVLGLRLQEAKVGTGAAGQLVVADEVPKDASVVVVVNPLFPLTNHVLDALRRYLDGGGKMLALINFDRQPIPPMVPQTGMDQLLARFNVRVDNAILFRNRGEREPPSARVAAYPAEGSTNRIATVLANQPLVLDLVRPVRPLAPAGRYRVEKLLEVPVENGLLEMDPRSRLPRQSSKPVPVAVAVVDTKKDQPRLVVVGDLGMATNPFQAANPLYADFLENSLDWLLGRGERLGIAPLKSGRYSVNLAAVTPSRMLLLPGWLVAVSILALGVGVWVVRRR